MPRQVRKVVSTAEVRTVAQTRAASAGRARASAFRPASGPSPRRTTRASSRKAPSPAGVQLAQLALHQAGAAPTAVAPQLALQQAPVPSSPPAVRQLRSRQVPLNFQNVCTPPEAANLILVQGKRRRSRSVTSRASESTCNGVDSPRGSRSARATKNNARMRVSTCTSRSLTRLTRQGDTGSPSRFKLSSTSSFSRARTVKVPLGKQEQTKQPAGEALVACSVCQDKLSPDVLEAHTDVCNLYLCPLACDTCQWRGTISQSVDHIGKNHRAVHCVRGPNAVIVLKSWRKAAPLHWTNLQTCLGHNFLVEIKKVEIFNKSPYFYGVVRLFGCQEDADRFEYRMVMKTRGKMARLLSYSTIVRALHNENSVLNEDDRFVFDSSQAEIFSYEGNLEIEVIISVVKM